MDYLSGGVRFQLYPRIRKHRVSTLICYPNGSVREQITFRGDMAAAEKHCKVLARTITSGDAALHLSALDKRVWLAVKETAARIGRQPDALLRDHLEAIEILGGKGTIIEAARCLRQQRATDLPRILISAVVAELLAFLETKRRDPKTVESLRSLYKPFVEAFGTFPINETTTLDLDRYLASLRLSARSMENHRAALVRLYNYASGRRRSRPTGQPGRYLPNDAATAADGIELVSEGEEDRGAVEIYKPWEFNALCCWLWERRRERDRLRRPYRDILPCVLLGGFAGLRTIELCRMEWSSIHFAELIEPGAAKESDAKAVVEKVTHPDGYIEVQRHVAKRHRTAARRIVPIHSNLAEWLDSYRMKQGPISPYLQPTSLVRAITTAIHDLNEHRRRHSQPPISRPNNGARHSYASYRLPEVGNAGTLAIEMNNSEAEIFEDYHDLVPPPDVPAWWKIRPPAEAVQIEFPNLAA